MNKPISSVLATVLLLSGILFSQSNCTAVKGYQKAYLNDDEMMLTNRKIEIFESNFQAYREGAVGGNNGNSGSGCGCN
ncbi:MAG: DUF4266 domain-containing protein [Cytophagales bacterium]|nr:DUF4266 domain-containing protein [Cytophagales bacterium]